MDAWKVDSKDASQADAMVEPRVVLPAVWTADQTAGVKVVQMGEL